MTPHGRWLDTALIDTLDRDTRGRRKVVRLERDLRYVDQDGVVHTTRRGLVFDGGTIPTFVGLLWRIIGHPLDPDFVRSTAMHDDECNKKVRPSSEVHRRFYHALRAEPIPAWKARAMYAAVATFGPRWTV